MLFEEFVKNVIKEFINEYDHKAVKDRWEHPENGKKRKNGGQKDFKKIAQTGIEANPMKNQDGSDFGWSSLLRDVPGSRYPRDNREGGNSIEGLNLNPDDETGKEIAYSLSFGNKNYKDKFLFAYGVHRMLYDGEVVSEKDKKILSDICVYLSENPSVLRNDLSSENMFSDRDWENGIANFYGMLFSDLKKLYAKDAKYYISQKSKNNVIESKIVTSNGYYVYPCYTFSTANSVGNTFKQGMCFFNSPTFWQQHTGDSGALFMFKRITDFEGGDKSESGLYNDNKSYNEIVISTHIDENGEVYIDGITNGNNVTYYNKDYHPANKLANSATDFDENDIKVTSYILGTINGEEVFEYCINRTKRRQDAKYDEMFRNGNYQLYVNLSNKNPEQKINDEEFNITLFPNDGKVYCIDHNNKRIFLIEPKGFITCNGREVQNTNTPFYQKINQYMPVFIKNWDGFRHNKRNKYVYSESKINNKNNVVNMKKIVRLTENDLHKIIKESVKRIIKEEVADTDCYDWNHNMWASQNSIDQDYDYEGELWSNDESIHAYLVEKCDDENCDSYSYNVETDDEELVFPEWFKFAKGMHESWIDNDSLYVTINGRNYIANWTNGELKPLQ